MKYINNPNIPERAVKYVLISEKEDELSLKLGDYAVMSIGITAHKSLYDAVMLHPDMQLCHLGNDVIVCSDVSATYCKELRKLGFKLIDSGSDISPKYPYDIPLNNAFLGRKHLICNTQYSSSTILKYANNNNINIIHTKQGYSKCSTCIVNDNAIITSDKSIYRSASKYGIDILLIQPGHIILDGLDYGFIGGASGLIHKNILAFTGDLSLHPDYKDIIKFTKKHSVECLCLSNEKLRDIGGIIPLICY